MASLPVAESATYGGTQRARLFFGTIRYLSVHQIATRLKRTIWRRLAAASRESGLAPTPCQWKSREQLLVGLNEVNEDSAWKPHIDEARCLVRRLESREFTFVNHTHRFEADVDWHCPAVSQLWRYYLHYFDYALDVMIAAAAGHRENCYLLWRGLVKSWIAGNPVIQGDGWHPYTISLRLVNWIIAGWFFRDETAADQEFSDLWGRSVGRQTTVLLRDLEHDVRGNHLFENIRALVCVGLALDGELPLKCFREGMRLLEKEVEEQILPDGGHFERSPRYHVIILKDCIEIASWMRRSGQDVPRWLDAAIRRMLGYLESILHPDGQMPLLKDTALDGVPSPSELLNLGALYLNQPRLKFSDGPGRLPLLLFGTKERTRFASWPIKAGCHGNRAFLQSGHFVMRDVAAGDFLIVDGGKVCPDYLPAHAHADLLSFELSLGGQRVIVDSGVYEYAQGPWRDFFRSTRAHNTVEVNRQNQSEVWSSFRVARRAYPRNVEWSESPEAVLFQAEHDGYNRLPSKATHRRSIWWFKGKVWVVLDQISGRGNLDARSFFHFHPRINAVLDQNVCRLRGASDDIFIANFGASRLKIVRGQNAPEKQGWYSEQFGIVTPNQVLQLEASALDRVTFIAVISKGTAARIEQVGHSFKVEWDGQTFVL